MTASVEDLLARLGPKSTSTYAEPTPAAEQSSPASPQQPDYVAYSAILGLPLNIVVPQALSAPSAERIECTAAVALAHFKVRVDTQWAGHYARNLLAHCDFRSVDLPEFSVVWDRLRATQLDWQEVLGLIGASADDDLDDDALLELTYVESTYARGPRAASNVPVRVDPNATRAARVYAADDAEGWVR